MTGYTVTPEENGYYRIDKKNGTAWSHFDSADDALRWAEEMYYSDHSLKRVTRTTYAEKSQRGYAELECGHKHRSEGGGEQEYCPYCYRALKKQGGGAARLIEVEGNK